VSGGVRLGLGQEVVEVEIAEDRNETAASGPRPLFDRSVPCELEVVAVGIGEIDGFVRAVIRQLPQWNARALQPPHRVSETCARGVVERDVVQSGDPIRLRPAAGRLPGVEPEVVVVAAGRDEQDVSRRPPPGHIARLRDDVEAEHADVEVAHAVDVGGPQMHVADPHAGIDRVRRLLDWRDVALRHQPKVQRTRSPSNPRCRNLDRYTCISDICRPDPPEDAVTTAQPRIGAVFPQTELGGDPGAVRAWVQAVTELGYGHIAVYDHVVGADPEVHAGWDRAYTVDTTFHEILVFFGFVAALTPLELVTSVVILPQRQTVLVAKQAAEIDLLTGGRFRLGVGIGWNPVEFEALGQRFSNRGARFEEQIELMRRLWTEPSLSFDGRYERVTGAGIRPLPVQRPIPVWIGGSVDAALARAGRIADGWFPQVQPGPDLEHAIGVVRDAAAAAGRDPSSIGMEGRVSLTGLAVDAVAAGVQAWHEAGATHVTINTMGAGNGTVEDHVTALGTVAQALALDRRLID
jgi:probable F420-dependent oxidoreductase